MPDETTNTGNGAAHPGVVNSPQTEATGRNQRREMRLQCDPTLVPLEVAGRSQAVEGEIVEVSKSGMQLRSGVLLNAGESVRAAHAGMIISGRIRYCRPNDAGSFDAGVEILDVQYTQ